MDRHDPLGMARDNPVPVTRRIPFPFPDDMDPLWHPRDPEFAAMINGASLTMPYLEPFLIRTVRAVMASSDDPQVREYGHAFNAQEQTHHQVHRRFNDLLKQKRYPEIADVEDQMAESYARIAKRSLRLRMAYTAGFEVMTVGLTKWLIGKRVHLFRGADTRVVSFAMWHMVEETEHKCIAHDIYQAAFGGSLSGYLARMVGVFHGTLHMLAYTRRYYRAILQHDGRTGFRSRLHLARKLCEFAWNVGPYVIKGALPGYDPRRNRDLQWVTDWLAGYAAHGGGEVPLLDTADPCMPVPFPRLDPAVGRAA